MKKLALSKIVPGKIYLIKHSQLGLWPCRVICTLEPGWKRGHVALFGSHADRGEVELLGLKEGHQVSRFTICKLPSDKEEWFTEDIGLVEHESNLLQKKIDQCRSIVEEYAAKLEVLELALKEHEESK